MFFASFFLHKNSSKMQIYSFFVIIDVVLTNNFYMGKFMSNLRYIFMVLPLAFALNINAQSAGVL